LNRTGSCCAPRTTQRTRPVQTETAAGNGQGRTSATDQELPYSFSRPRSAMQRQSGKSCSGVSNLWSRGDPFLDPLGPRPAFGRPRSPPKNCDSGRQSRHQWAQIEMGHGGQGLVHGWVIGRSHGQEPRRSEWTRMNHVSRIWMFAGTG
jgi:hypothetical protein